MFSTGAARIDCQGWLSGFERWWCAPQKDQREAIGNGVGFHIAAMCRDEESGAALGEAPEFCPRKRAATIVPNQFFTAIVWHNRPTISVMIDTVCVFRHMGREQLFSGRC